MVILVFVAVLLLQFAATLAALVDRHLDLGAVDIMLTMGPLALHHHHLHWPEAGLVRDAVIGLNIAGASTPLNHHMVWHNLKRRTLRDKKVKRKCFRRKNLIIFYLKIRGKITEVHSISLHLPPDSSEVQ